MTVALCSTEGTNGLKASVSDHIDLLHDIADHRRKTPYRVCWSHTLPNITFDKNSADSGITKVDKKGKPNQLRFPPFHTEMLDQTWVNPTQDLGRIKVIIAEGIRPSPASGFEKIRNVVIFSFQHVPLRMPFIQASFDSTDILLAILEDTGIAWPNHGMWYQAAPQFENVLSPRKAKEIDPDSHAHSPRRQHGRDQSRMTLSSDTQKLHGTNLAHAAPMRQVGNTSSRMALQQPPHMPDPFVGDGKPVDRRSSLFSKGHESSRRSDPRSADVVMTDRMILPYSDCDQSMPDCSRPLSPTSLRSVQMADFSRPPSFTNARIHTIPDSNRSPSLCDGARSRQMSGWEQALSGLGPLSVAAVQEAKGKPLENTSDEVGEGRAPLVEYARDNGDGFFEEGLSTCTPDRAKVDGTLAPVNTRVSSAITTPSTETRASSTREARYSSYSGKARVVSHTTRDPPTFAARSALGSSTKERSTSHKSPFGTLEEKDIENPKAQSVFNKMPASDVKGRKEGRTSEINLEVPCDDDHKACSASHSGHNKENHDASGMANTPRGDNKRRRISSVLEPDVVASNFSKDESKENSPMKHNDIDDLTAEGIITRTPLDQLDENIL